MAQESTGARGVVAKIMKAELAVYARKLVPTVANKAWLAWGIGSGLVAMVIWLLPKAFTGEPNGGSSSPNWWEANGGWLGLGIFLTVLFLFAPFLVWRSEYYENTKLRLENTNLRVENERLNSEDIGLERRKTELEVKKLESDTEDVLVVGK